MAVSGTINVNASFLDATSSTANESQKKLSLASAKIVDGGKVAIVSGTIGTAARSFIPNSGFLDYRDSSGEIVKFGVGMGITPAVFGIAFQSDGPANAWRSVNSRPSIYSDNQETSYSKAYFSALESISVKADSGTCNYTLIVYGI